MAKEGTIHMLVTYTLVGLLGYTGYNYGLQGHLGPSVQQAMQTIRDTFFPGSGGGGGSEACELARIRMAALDPSWAGASCTQIKTAVCSSTTLFVGTSGEDVTIRTAFGCPLR